MRKSVRWGVIALAALVPFAMSAQAGDHAYVGAKKCKMCHKVEFTSWQATKHAKATDTAKAGAEGRSFEPSCLKCHATNADENLPGVQCEACHGPGANYKKMSVMKDMEKAMANGLLIATQATCDGCHDGQDHHKKKVFKDELDNRDAIHKFKKPELAKKMLTMGK